jgi:hypothetical protein
MMGHLNRAFDWIRAASPRPWFWLGGPLLLYSWTITGPLLSDDLHLILKSERYLRGETPQADLFRFASTDEAWNELRNRGTVPWWLPEKGRQDYLRPLADWSFLLSVRAFGRNAVGHRIVSVAMLAGALVAVYWMLRRVPADPTRAGAATFFFGISQTVAAPTVWMCNRSELLVVQGAAVAAGAYWAAWNRPGRWQLPVAAVGFLYALLSKEVAIALCAVIAGHELVARLRRRERYQRPLNAAIAGALVVIAGGYLGYYRYSRPWAFGSGGADGAPPAAGTSWPLSILLDFGVWTMGFPIDALLMATPAQILAVAVASAALGVVAILLLLRSAKGDPAALFFSLWAVLFLIPSLPAFAPSARYLCAATVGWTYLLAGLILPASEERAATPYWARHWLLTANATVNICCIIGTVLYVNQAESAARRQIEEFVAGCSPPLADGQALVATQADSVVANICGGDRLEYLTGLRDVAFTYLFPPGIDATAEVEDAHTLLLRAGGTSLFGSRLHDLTLPKNWRPRVGQTIQMREFTAEIADIRGDDFVAALRLRFDEPLASDRLHFFPPSLHRAAKSTAAAPASPSGVSR